jgi:hypothetical protein
VRADGQTKASQHYKDDLVLVASADAPVGRIAAPVPA